MNILNKSRSFIRMAFFFLLINVVGALFSFVGAPMLRVFYQNTSKSVYWAATLVWILLFFNSSTFILATMMFNLWLVVGLYSYFEFKFIKNPYQGILIATLVATGISLLLGLFALSQIGITMSSLVDQIVLPFKQSIEKSGLTWSSEKLVFWVPSLFGTLVLSNLVFALVLDRRMSLLMGLPFKFLASSPKFYDYKSPDSLIWIFLISLAGLLIKNMDPLVSAIFVNVSIFLAGIFFLQGLAILESVLFIIRAGLFIRILVYVLLIGQLFFVLVGIGLIDYWVDFRSKFSKWFNQIK